MRPTTPEMLQEARHLVRENPSTSYIQRKLEIGYNHACEIMEQFEVDGLVSRPDSTGFRRFLGAAMNPFVERAARAMWEQRRAHAAKSSIEIEPWGDGVIPRANGIEAEARAVLSAIRSPTAEMVAAGNKLTDWASGADDAWEAMIDAALGSP